MADHDDIINKVSEILGEILDEPSLRLSDETVAEDVDGWDSINHVKLVIEIERIYKVRFEPDEITAPENVGKFVELIQQHIATGR